MWKKEEGITKRGDVKAKENEGEMEMKKNGGGGRDWEDKGKKSEIKKRWRNKTGNREKGDKRRERKIIRCCRTKKNKTRE